MPGTLSVNVDGIGDDLLPSAQHVEPKRVHVVLSGCCISTVDQPHVAVAAETLQRETVSTPTEIARLFATAQLTD